MNLEQAAIDYAKNVVECNPDAKNAVGLIHTAVIYGASLITVTEGMTFGQANRASELADSIIGEEVKCHRTDSEEIYDPDTEFRFRCDVEAE